MGPIQKLRMKYTNCEKCGVEVSTADDECPFCGREVPLHPDQILQRRIRGLLLPLVISGGYVGITYVYIGKIGTKSMLLAVGIACLVLALEAVEFWYIGFPSGTWSDYDSRKDVTCTLPETAPSEEIVKRVEWEGYVLKVNIVETRSLYEQVEAGHPERCSCRPCENFRQIRPEIYPKSFLDLLDCLGVDPTIEGETAHLFDDEKEQHEYWIHFHFVGIIEERPDVERSSEEDLFFQLKENVSMKFTENCAPSALETQKHLSEVQVIIDDVPWVLDEEPTGRPAQKDE